MTENEFLLNDRIQKIQQIINKYGENNFYISYSGGKDSVVLSHLIDLALPNNEIPRVYSNTGIEFNNMVEFVRSNQQNDLRIIILKPRYKIRPILERYGYPFKSKLHSHVLDIYQRNGRTRTVENYTTYNKSGKGSQHKSPKILLYQFDKSFNLRISDKCCYIMKEKPLIDWAITNNKLYTITGIMRAEGGRRDRANCLTYVNKKLKSFNPLAPMSLDWEQWFINKYNLKLCKLYYPPFNFLRTGCKGCPFNINLEHELDLLENVLPNERKQCEIIWKPVYDEYRRIGYRLRK